MSADETTYMMFKRCSLDELERSFNSMWSAHEQRNYVKAMAKKVDELRARIGEPPIECRCCGEKEHTNGLCDNCFERMHGWRPRFEAKLRRVAAEIAGGEG